MLIYYNQDINKIVRYNLVSSVTIFTRHPLKSDKHEAILIPLDRKISKCTTTQKSTVVSFAVHFNAVFFVYGFRFLTVVYLSVGGSPHCLVVNMADAVCSKFH